MMRCCACLVVLICWLLFFDGCRCIILANREQPKPAYSPGLKTAGWRNQNNLETHQNYSKVYVHNNPASPPQYVITKTQKSERVYPIYNAHAYGHVPEQTQKIVERPDNSTNQGHLASAVGANIAGSHRNRTIYKWKIEYKTIEVYEKCPEGATGSFVYYLSCNQFLNCWKGRGEVQNCAPGTLFNPKTLECDFPDKVECVTSRQNSISLQKSRSQKSITQATCPKEFSGLIPNYTDCSKFISCNNGHQTAMDCPPGTLFDSTLNLCNYPHLTTCFNTGSGGSQSNDAFNYGGQQQFSQSGQHQGYQYGGQNAASQAGGQYYHTVSSQGQGGQVDGSTQYSTGSRTNVQGQYGAGSYGQSHINSKLDFDQNSGAQAHTNQGYGFYAHSSQGTSTCNPQIQNCASIGLPSVQNCDPQTQNCGQVSSTAYNQVYGYAYVPTCDPRKQNCGESNRGQTYGQNFVPGCDPRLQNCNQGQGQFVAQGCDSRVQNCGQSTHQQAYGSTHQQGYGQSFVTSCNPQTQNCGRGTVVQGSNQWQGTGQACASQDEKCSQSHGKINGQEAFGQSHGSGQRNYHTICNINDANCRRNRTTVVKKSKEPKCPDNFQGITKHPSDCKKFLNCANGRTFIQDCAPGTLFNPAIGNCDFPYNVDCSSNDGDEDETTDNYDENTESGWDNTYEEHSLKYGQNAGHGNIRAESTTTYRGSINQGQGSYYQGQFPNQGHTTYVQGQWNQNQGPQGSRDVKTTQSVYQQQRPTSQGSGVTIFTNLTPRPPPVTYLPSETVVNRGQVGLVRRPALNQVDASNKRNNAQDYVDIFNPNERNGYSSLTTARSVSKWPPPFPSTDVNADYVFEYEDGEPVTLEPENVFRVDKSKKKKAQCGDDDFYCTSNTCISKSAACDGHRDCQNGRDESDCQEYLKKFALSKNSQLNVLEDQRWMNVSQATCALLCMNSKSFECRSFNYRKIDRTCFLSNLNIGLTGSLREYYPYDYYELKTATIDCSMLFECNNKKCIASTQLCDGIGDCGEREDEKNCKPEDFGYSVKLAGTDKPNEGRVEVTAFGKTGYICDDHFGIKDANVICRELGFFLGAAEVKGNSYYASDLKEEKTLYMVDDLDCLGNETTLLDCSFPGWGVHNCRNQEIAGLVCKTPQEKCGKGSWKCDSGNECIPYAFVCDGIFDCTDDSDEAVQHCEAPTELRLVNGSRDREGRIEIKHHGIWGTICDDDFNEDAAKVVCKYFGFKGKSTVKKDSYFGEGEGPIWLDQVSCYGNETDLRTCTQWNWGEHNCDHSEDVGVICSDEMEEIQLQRHSKINDRYVSSTASPHISCGFRKDNQFLEDDLIHPRVVGGYVANKGDYPWQAALRIKGKAQQSHHWCGAIILSGQWVLTAAHCLLGYAKGAYMIVAGEYNTDEEEGTEQTKYIEEYFIHDNFTEGDRVMKNDIALIKVKGNGFLLNRDVQPICLPDEDVDYERDLNCTISGFGSVKTGNSAYSHNLMAAWIPLIRTEICKMPHVYDVALSEGMICAGFLNGGVDSCHGDSGGPLACLDNGLFTVYGITSWGHRCGFANKPGVYVKVAHYRKWIDVTIRENS